MLSTISMATLQTTEEQTLDLFQPKLTVKTEQSEKTIHQDTVVSTTDLKISYISLGEQSTVNGYTRVPKHSSKQGEIIKPSVDSKKVLLLGGCVQPVLAPNINHSIKNILAKLGYDAIETPQKQCCGAVDQHLSAEQDAMVKIKANIDAWLAYDVDSIISSASGCGLMVKDYASMFKAGDDYYQKAKLVSSKTQDIAEFLADKNLSKLNLEKVNISYHEPCTLQHGQKLAGLVNSILDSLGYHPAKVQDSHLCCGSAGTYSIFQPKLSQTLKINKLEHLQASNPQMIVTANIGCLMHLQKGSKTPVKHWVELLDC